MDQNSALSTPGELEDTSYHLAESSSSSFWLLEKTTKEVCKNVRLALRPPVDLQIDYEAGQYLIIIPYADYEIDVELVSEHLSTNRLRGRVNGLCGLLIPPVDSAQIKTAHPAELLVVEVGKGRAERIIDRATGGLPWQAKPVMNMIEPGLANLASEGRRCILSDPILTPPYLESLADAIMTRLACKMVGLGMGLMPKEALPRTVLKRVIDKVNEDLADKIRVEDLADIAGLSRSHFSRAFQAATGQSPRDFMIQRRVCEARERLTNSEQAISQIAFDSGFSSQSHLNRVFKKSLGLTPKQYRDAFRAKRVS